MDSERLKTWEKKTIFCCPPESLNFAFIKRLFKNRLPTKIVIMYQTIWLIDISLIEPNRIYVSSTWW